MQYFAIAFAVGFVLPTAFAQPHGHGHHGHHHSGAPSASPTSGAPYNLNNGTASELATGTGSGSNTQYHTLTIKSTLYYTPQASSSQAPSESAAVEGGGSNTDSCSSITTVTLNPTTTVYVTAGAESAVGSSAAPIESGLESATSIKASSAAPVAPVSTKLASIAPVQSSPAPAPETSSTPVATQAASSAPVASSVAPLQSSAAAPPSPSTSTTATTPPQGGSGVTTGDYCSSTRDASGNVLPYTGANYTGGVAGKKRGIVFVDGTDAWKAGFYNYTDANPSVSWIGNYYSEAPDWWLKETKTEFVPQMYGKQSVNEWKQKADKAVNTYHLKHFLSFGEPGTPNPKNHDDPPDGAQLYMDQMQPYTEQGVTIGAPGSLQNKQDWTWEQDFLCDCQKLNCNIGFVAAHWFDDAAPLAQQVERAKGTIETYINVAKGRPLWMDNIYAKGTVEDQKAFMDELVPWLEKNAAIERYGWVPQDSPTGTGFTNMDGTVTELGKHYASL